VEVAVGEHNEPVPLGPGLLAGLFLAEERVLVLRFVLKDNERKALIVEQQEIIAALVVLLEVLAKSIQIG
jgi:hypothetical protein